jgi:hypothetical protein
MPSYDKKTNTYTNDDGTTYVPSRGRKPAWVTAYIESLESKSEPVTEKPVEKQVEKIETTNHPIKEIIVTENSKDKMNSIFDNKVYKDFINNLNLSKIHVNGKTVDTNAKDIMVRLSFTMTQCGIQPMSFNTNFNSVQKADDGTLVMSAECFNRHAFGQNDLQTDFTVNGLKDMNILLRGGIKTDKDNKKNNVSLTKVINTSVRSKSYKAVNNDRLGFKADDNGENYLCEEQLFLDTVFDVKINVSINQFLKNVMGQDFAQTNALKVITATDAECTDFIATCIPTKAGTLDIDAIVDTVKSKIKDGMKHFSHRGICAEFTLSDISVTADHI